MAEYPPERWAQSTNIKSATSQDFGSPNGAKSKGINEDRKGDRTKDKPQPGNKIGLGDLDIERDVYEGGFKSWEAAMDLARLLLERGPRKDIDELSRIGAVIEVSSS